MLSFMKHTQGRGLGHLYYLSFLQSCSFDRFARFEGHTANVLCCAFALNSPQLLVTAGEDRAFKVSRDLGLDYVFFFFISFLFLRFHSYFVTALLFERFGTYPSMFYSTNLPY